MDARLSRMSEQQFDWVIAANLKSVFLMTQTFSQSMIDAKYEDSSIINISSIGKFANIEQ
jgi:NAD(P)-dependent dehydrogenase (short-subunit alcohol dehydrogenase family)